MSDEVLSDRAVKARDRFEVPVLIAALAVVPVIIIEERVATQPWITAAAIANWLIWAAFVAEFTVVYSLTGDRWAYTKRAWLDLFIIVVSFPALPSVLASTRLARLTRLTRALRILRLARLAAVLSRGGQAARRIFARRGLGYIAVLTILMALGVGGVFAVIEDVPILDGLWWALVTLTTVGYGDVYPVTAAGRISASILMLVGIGFVAFITASVAAHFVDSDEDSTLATEIKRLHERLDRIEAGFDQSADISGSSQAASKHDKPSDLGQPPLG